MFTYRYKYITYRVPHRSPPRAAHSGLPASVGGGAAVDVAAAPTGLEAGGAAGMLVLCT